jgi:hypothetical protein
MMKYHVAQTHNAEGSRYACHICDGRFLRGHYLTKHLARKHAFRQPAGHSRFKYKLDEDGMYRVQTVRFESGELVIDLDAGGGGGRVEEDDDDEVDVDDVDPMSCATQIIK